MSTFRDLWPSDKRRLSGALDGYYHDFVQAIRAGISIETFTPAHMGSCLVPHIVQQPVDFVVPGSGLFSH